jgi:hypothetical protein
MDNKLLCKVHMEDSSSAGHIRKNVNNWVNSYCRLQSQTFVFEILNDKNQYCSYIERLHISNRLMNVLQ